MVRVHLFGRVGATTDDGRPIDVGPAKCQTVLAALALSVGSPVPVSRLIELVWDDQPPRTANKTLQSYVTRLRGGLGADTIERSGAAYRLDVEADAVDVARFRRHLDADDVDAALAEWTATPLAGLDAPGLAAAVHGLVEQWLGATERQLRRLVDSDPHAAIGRLTDLTEQHPFREGLWALLMTALYRDGRQADALAAYGAARQRLVDDLGVEPGARLRELEAAILAQDARLDIAHTATVADADAPTGTVTFGVAEVDHAMRLWAALGDDVAAAAGQLDALTRDTADRHGGHVFATGGASLGVAFQRAVDGAAWARELHDAITRGSWPAGVVVRLRIGLHTGAVAADVAGYVGPAVQIASAMAAMAHGDQTLVSEASAALLDPADLRALGRFRIASTMAEQRVFQLGAGEFPPPRAESGRHGNVPRRPGRLIGRDTELKAIGDALATTRIVTLVGPGGIGKTRLALTAAALTADDFPDGAWLIELAEIASPDDVPRVVADVLDVSDDPTRPLTRSIATGLASRTALLVLDNCEHVIDGVAALAQVIADGCPDARVLATSREGLEVGDEQVVAVGPLDPGGAAVELFHERALAAGGAFDLDACRGDVEEVCRRLDGVPLAIELAAARTRTLTPPALRARLHDRLRLLTGGSRSGPAHHRTLRATIQWSYDLLAPRERTVLRRLSVFAGQFDLTAAEAIAADADLDDIDVDDALDGLVRRSLVAVERGPVERRFRLLDTIRQFAAELLDGDGDAGDVVGRHTDWCLETVTDIHRLLAGHDEHEGVARLDALWPDLRAAVDRACTAADPHLVHALIAPVVGEINLRSAIELGDWVERLLAITPAEDEDLLVDGIAWAAQRYSITQDGDGFERLVARFGEPAHVLVRHARTYVHDDYDALVELAPLAVAELRRRGDDYLAELYEPDLGVALLNLGRYAEHDAHVSVLAERYRAHGPPTLHNWSLLLLGYSAAAQGRRSDAERLFDDAVSIEVPPRTHSPNRAIEAGVAFRRGARAHGYRLLRAHVVGLLETTNMQAASMAAVEFVSMMAAIDRLDHAARALGYLDTTGVLQAAAFRTLVADAAEQVAGDPTLEAASAAGRTMDDHRALTQMRDVLTDLLR